MMRQPLILGCLVTLAAAASVRYDIHAHRERPDRLEATADITITNPLPDTLRAVTLLLHPNAVAAPAGPYAGERERSGRFDLALTPARLRGGFTRLVNLGTGEQVPPASAALTVTLALAPGDSTQLRFGYTLELGEPFAEFGRRGREALLAHWYPQVATLAGTVDDYHLFGHSAAEPADYSVSLLVPSDLSVAASVSSRDTFCRWLHWPPELRPGDAEPYRAWHFAASGISDFAAVISPAFVLQSDSVAGTRINVLSRHPARLDWLGLPARIADMVSVFSRWYGPPPFSELTVVQADGLAPADACYPGLIVTAQRPVPSVRVFESTLARLVAAQWFAWPHSVDELDAPWLALGPAACAEMRYMEKRHGPTSLLDPPLLSRLLRGASVEYYHRLVNYVAATNDLLRPLDAPRSAFDNSFEYNASQVSSAGLLFRRLSDSLGPSTYDSLLRSSLCHLTSAVCTLHSGPCPLPSSLCPLSLSLDTCSPFSLWRSHPTRTTLRPVFALPEFDTYQLFYGPYAWYDTYHGFQLALWAQGRRFIDTGPLRGSHQWTLSETYSTALDDWHSSLWYQTPLYCLSPRLRAIVRLDYSLVSAEARAGFQQEFGRVFGMPNTLVELTYRLFQLSSTRGRDPRAWDSARTADIRWQMTHNYETARLLGRERAFAARGLTELGGRYDYWKLWLEQDHSLRLSRKSAIRVRAFAGLILGDVPNQEQYYLSGGLYSYPDEPVSWGYKGFSSGQEHWHYDGDCNLRAYAGSYYHGKAAWALNLYLAPIPQVQPFFDIGSFADSLSGPELLHPYMDAGIRLRLGPLYADFPIWKSRPEPDERALAFRWMLGFHLSDLLTN